MKETPLLIEYPFLNQLSMRDEEALLRMLLYLQLEEKALVSSNKEKQS